MNEHLYAYLNEWGKNNKISFWVTWRSDAHVLTVLEHRGWMCRALHVIYPHHGGCRVIDKWAFDGKPREFVELFDVFRGRIPLQPCDELGYVEGDGHKVHVPSKSYAGFAAAR